MRVLRTWTMHYARTVHFTCPQNAPCSLTAHCSPRYTTQGALNIRIMSFRSVVFRLLNKFERLYQRDLNVGLAVVRTTVMGTLDFVKRLRQLWHDT